MGHDYARNYILTAVSLAFLFALTGCGAGGGGSPKGSTDAKLAAEAASADPSQVHIVAMISSQETIDSGVSANSASLVGRGVAADSQLLYNAAEMVSCHEPKSFCDLSAADREITREQYQGIKRVIVNIETVELKVREQNGNERLVLIPQIAVVDLLDMMKGVQIALDKVSFPNKVEVQHIRFILAASGHYIEYENGKKYDLKTPSAQESGLKIQVAKGAAVFEKGY